MVRKSVQKFALVVLLMFGASFAVAQRNNVPSFVASESHEEGVINLYALTPSFDFVVLPKSQGALPGSIVLEAPQSCHPFAVGSSTDTACGVLGDALVDLVFVSNPLFNLGTDATVVLNNSCYIFTVNHIVAMDGSSAYSIPTTTLYYPSTCGTNSTTVTANDGSGITATIKAANLSTVTVTAAQNTSGWTWNSTSSSTVDDAFSNTVSFQSSPNGFVDSLGAVTTVDHDINPTSFGYTDTSGTSRSITTTTGTASTFQPLSTGCGTGNTGNSVTPITSINFPDGTSIGLGWDTHNSGLDGLINKVTLRTGGAITYTYGTASCGSTGMSFATLSRATTDGTSTYTQGSWDGGTEPNTTELDPGKNKTVYQFWTNSTPTLNVFNQSIARYQNTGSVGTPAYTEISSTSYCYNNHISDCSTYVPVLPITQLDTYQYTYNGATQVTMSHDVKLFDSTYGLLTSDAATDSINSQTITTTYVYGTYSSGSCSAITNTAIVDHPCTVTTKNGSTWLSESTYTYNANGALTSSSACLSSTCTGSSALTTTYTPTTHGTYSAIQAPNGQTVNYTYGSCNSLMPTDVTTTVNSIAIDHKATWNCNAGVVTDTTDPNSNEDDYVYDSMNRPSSYTDRTDFVTNFSFPTSTSFKTNWSMTSPSASSATTVTVDGLGRPVNMQTTHGSNYDTLSSSYAWSGTNFQTQTSEPCSTTTIGATGCTTFAHTITTNPFQGLVTSTTTSNETLTGTISANDASLKLSPAPGTENNKIVQQEFDGFGRLKSICALEASGGTSCGQTMGNSGILTSYSYSYATGSYTTTITRGSQTRTLIYDAVGRLTSEAYPESGTTTYTYDSIPANTCNSGDAAYTSTGDLLESVDGASNKLCYHYDGLHRLTDVYSNHEVQNSGNTYCRHYRYDSTANEAITDPNSTLRTNVIGRLIEAYTDTCASTISASSNAFFGYDADGRITDYDSNSLHRTGYANVEATYFANGELDTLNNTNGGVTQCCYTVALDTNGNPNTATWPGATNTTVVNGITYDSGGRPTTVNVGSTSGDKDTFGFDSNTGLMNATSFIINSTTESVNPTWNANETLGSVAITDGFNSGGTQGCAYGYDDVARLTSVTNASGSTCNGTQTYTYDQYDNLTQAGTWSWAPGYSSTTNHETGATYDSAGNETNDGVNTYTYDAYGKMVSARAGSSAAVCGTSGTCYVYDAFGVIAEADPTTSWIQISHGPGGFTQFYDGTNVTVRLPVPGGGSLFASGTNLQTLQFMHPDWLGSIRQVTSISGRSSTYDTAYTPYGRTYSTFGTANSSYTGFTGDFQDAFAGLWETPNRQLFVNAGRWRSPDPAHSGWNAYAYVTDPNTQTDPSGLDPQGQNVKVIPFLDCRPDNPCDAQGNDGGSQIVEYKIGDLFETTPLVGFVGSTGAPTGPPKLLSGWSGIKSSIKSWWHGTDESPGEFYAHNKPWWIERVFQAHTPTQATLQLVGPMAIDVAGGGGYILNGREAAGVVRTAMSNIGVGSVNNETLNRYIFRGMFQELADLAEGNSSLSGPATKAINLMRGVHGSNEGMIALDIHNAIVASGPELVQYFRGIGFEILTSPQALAEYRMSGAYLFRASPFFPFPPAGSQ